MNPEALKQRVLDEFESIGLLKCLDTETSAFNELPRFFETSHLCMRLVLDDVGAVAAASNVAAEIKRDLERQGIELEYEIRALWKVANVSSDVLEDSGPAGLMPADHFHAEVESGSAKRLVDIHMSAGARSYIQQCLAHVSPEDRQSAICKMLAACLNQKLSSQGEEYWDPVLYHGRDLEVADVARVVEGLMELRNRPSV
jgi:hypothetical protein